MLHRAWICAAPSVSRIIFSLIAFCGLLNLSAAAYAGAWLQPADTGLLISQFFMSESTEVTDFNGTRRKQEPYKQWGQSLYAEWGMNDAITVGSSLNLIYAQQNIPAIGGDGVASALTDFNLFARYGIWRDGDDRLSVQFTTQLPRQHFQEEGLSLGNPDMEYEMALQYGRSLTLTLSEATTIPAFIDAHLGYRVRAAQPDDQIRSMLTAGITPVENWQFFLQGFGTFRTDRSTPAAGAGFTQSNADDYDQVRLQASAVWQVHPGWAVQAGYFQDVYGRNFGEARGVLFGIWRQL